MNLKDASLLQNKAFLAGEWQGAEDGATFDVKNPATGALRGAGNTHAGLIVQIIGYWIIGLPVGYLLAFRLHHGAVGLWLGLCTGLIVAGISLTTTWRYTTRKLALNS